MAHRFRDLSACLVGPSVLGLWRPMKEAHGKVKAHVSRLEVKERMSKSRGAHSLLKETSPRAERRPSRTSLLRAYHLSVLLS